MYNIDGYAAAANVTGAGVIPETDAKYKKIYTPADFMNAVTGIKGGTTKVMEIMNDLDLGYEEVGATVRAISTAFDTNYAPVLHPKLIVTGVSVITIDNFNGLTLFSKNGSTLRHTELNVKNGGNLIIRNLKFDEMWEWDEQTKGDYDKNDWDYITIGDTSSETNKIWIDHCTFYKTYDGIVDIKKGAGIVGKTNGITISWSQILPGDGSNGTFIGQMFDKLEGSRASYPMYNFLRNYFSKDEIIQVSTTVKKGHLIGALDLKEPSGYMVTLHHNYYKDLQDRMPRLRTGDVQVFNLFADSSTARITKEMVTKKLADNPALATAINAGTYHFGITSNGTISTEGGTIEVTNSLYVGVLTPLRNNQTDVTNPLYTGAIRAFGIQHELLSTDTSYMPVPNGSGYSALGYSWIVWSGDSASPNSSLGPREATPIVFSWHNGTPPTPKTLHSAAQLKTLLQTGSEPAGAGKLNMTTAQWLNANN